MLTPEYAHRFKKDKQLMERRRRDMLKLKDVIELIVNEIPLPAQYHEHPLHGNYDGFTECHIEPDWLLVYRFEEGAVYFSCTGTHSDLF